MEPCIDVIGVAADGSAGLRPELVERVRAADFLAGGERHLQSFGDARGERFVIRDNLSALCEQLARRRAREHCVVLASGDPLFYGIGTVLAGHFGSESVRIEPALSSMQLAFARVGVSWQGAALASVHGRALRPTLLPLLGRSPVGLFTQDGDSPAAVARFFLDRGPADYEAAVGEKLGAADERVSAWLSLKALTTRRFDPLNYLILRRTCDPGHCRAIERLRSQVPGVPDELFIRPEQGTEMMTRQEVRSVALGKLAGPTEPGDVAWDIGAGLGTVAIELAVLRPHLEVIASERDADRADLLRRNRERFGAYNVRIVEGEAPGSLAGEADHPCRVFLGGSGERLPAILDFVARQLRPAGRLVANFVTLENLSLTLERVRGWGWPVEVTEIHVSRSDGLAGRTGLRPHRGVFLVCADKPESEA